MEMSNIRMKCRLSPQDNLRLSGDHFCGMLDPNIPTSKRSWSLTIVCISRLLTHILNFSINLQLITLSRNAGQNISSTTKKNQTAPQITMAGSTLNTRCTRNCSFFLMTLIRGCTTHHTTILCKITGMNHIFRRQSRKGLLHRWVLELIPSGLFLFLSLQESERGQVFLMKPNMPHLLRVRSHYSKPP